MTPANFLRTAVAPALGLLPEAMQTSDAHAMLIAIALQESGLHARRQLFNGPGRSYFQFELGAHPTDGVTGVLNHPRSAARVHEFCLALDIGPTPPAVYEAIEFHDVLACGCARLLLWTLPRRLPQKDESFEGWRQYLELWRPGKPHKETWAQNFLDAWQIVSA